MVLVTLRRPTSGAWESLYVPLSLSLCLSLSLPVFSLTLALFLSRSLSLICVPRSRTCSFSLFLSTSADRVRRWHATPQWCSHYEGHPASLRGRLSHLQGPLVVFVFVSLSLFFLSLSLSLSLSLCGVGNLSSYLHSDVALASERQPRKCLLFTWLICSSESVPVG
jgi:hypothetical protein